MATTSRGISLASSTAALHVQRSPAPGPLPQPQASLTTETLYRTPPTTVPPPPPPDEGNGGGIPIAAIAGGAAAGALLAIVVVIGWVWWGRQIKRDAAVRRMEAATRRNTLQNAGSGTAAGRISRPKARSALYGRPVEKAVSFAAPPTTLNDPPSRVVPEISSEKTANGSPRSKNEAKVNGIVKNGTTPTAAVHTAARVHPPHPPPVSQTRGKRPAYSRRSLKPAPRGILTQPASYASQGHRATDGQQGQGHNRQDSAATVTPLLADYYMDENRGRRVGDVEQGPEHGHEVRRTPSGLLWAALGLGGGERNSRNSLRTRDSRWSWTSSLDLRLFGRTGRDAGNSKSARTTVVEDDKASGSVAMGVAM